ncbi:MAG: choice-of-anchor D domain-containing protein, partial [Candidatus Lokiarchaeota archaeon]|nr:choice-of-anchor D domain-containing protein [Candidatus Lokiarchaeota archaeon]
DSSGNESEFSNEVSAKPFSNELSGDVSGIWTKANSPYYVVNDIAVQVGDSLIIEPGVQIRFRGKYKFVVYGKLKAVGRPDDNILFTRDQDSEENNWRGLGFKDASKLNELKYCTFEYIDQHEILYYPLEWKGCIHAEYSNVKMSHCYVGKNYGNWAAIYFYRSSSRESIISRNLVVNNKGNGIHATECENVTIINNTVIKSTDNGICCSKLSGRGEIINNILYENNIGIGGHGGGTFYIAYNNLWSNGTDYDFWDSFSPVFEVPIGTEDVIANPMFTGDEPLTYQLQENSPCIDTGDPSSPLDPDGTRADIGAFYFHQDDGIAPVKPQNLQAIDGENQVSLSWNPNTESDLAHYKIYRSQTQGLIPTTNDSLTIVYKPNASYIDNDVVNFETYYYRISAVDISGNESEFSNEAEATPFYISPDPPKISLSESSYNFGSVELNTTKSWQLIIKNLGEQILLFADIKNSQSVFSAMPTSGAVPQNDSLIVELSFTPIHEQTYQDTFIISCNDPEKSRVQFIVQGQGISSSLNPSIQLSINSHNFGNVLRDSTRECKLTIKNMDQGDLIIHNITNTESVFSANPTSRTITAHDSIIVTISFTPREEKPYQDIFTISSNDPDNSTVIFSVYGYGVVVPQPSISLQTTTHNFGDVPMFSSAVWQFIIQNSGNMELEVNNIVSDNPVFTVSSNQFTLIPDNQKTIQVQFNPDSVKSESCTITITSNDPNQTTVNVNLSGNGVDNQAPEITIQTPTQDMRINTEHHISVQVTDNWNVSSVYLFYRKGTTANFQNISMNINQNDIYTATIPASEVTCNGIAYFVKAEDESGHTTVSDTLSHEIYFDNGSLSTNIQYSAYVNGFPRGQWYMLSIPAILNNISVGAVLNDESELGSYGEPNWRLFSYEDTNDDGINDGYQEFNSEPSNFRFNSGKSFWLKANPEGDLIEIDVGAGYILPLDPITITLKPGWNQIGNPFAFPIRFPNLNPVISDKLYLPTGNGGYQLTEIMHPWAGYFIYVAGAQEIDLTLEPAISTSLPKSKIDETEWMLQLSASAGHSKDDINFIGISPTSSNEWDNNDYPEPPTIGEFVSLRFPHRDWEKYCQYYTSDIRYSIDNGQVWEFEVTSNLNNAEIVLNWSELKPSLSDLRYKLYDIDRNKSVDMNISDEYRYWQTSQFDHSAFQIFVGDAAFIEKQITERQSRIPANFQLFQNYPNPFNPVTTIKFSLPRASVVTLKVVDVLGREVSTLLNEKRQPGIYEVVFNTEELQSGIYIYRL